MAYIDWWNRSGPVTLGERFGLNEGGRISYQGAGLVQPGVPGVRQGYGEREYIKPGLYKTAGGYAVIVQRGEDVRYQPPVFKKRKEAEEALAKFVKKHPPATALVPEGAEKFLKNYLKKRDLKSWDDLDKTQKQNFIKSAWPKHQEQQTLIKGMIAESEMAERLGISKEKLADFRKKDRPKVPEGSKVFHRKLVSLIGEPVNLAGVAGEVLGKGEVIYYNPINNKDVKIVQKYLPKEFGFISQDVTNRIKTLANDNWFMDRLKKVKNVSDVTKFLPLEELIDRYPELKLTDSKLSKAVVYLGQIMQGHVEYRGLEDIGLNKVVGNRINKMIENAPFGNIFKRDSYAIAMANIDRQFGDEVGTFANYRDKIKTEFKRLGFDNFKKFNLDEYVGASIGGWKESGPFSVFTRLLAENINQESGASYLGRLSQAADALEAAINAEGGADWRAATRIVNSNKADALRTIKKTKNTMPYLSLSPPGSKENFGIKRLNQLEAQGLEIKDFFKEKKYTYSGLGEAWTQKEILANPKQAFTDIIKKLPYADQVKIAKVLKCPWSKGKAEGGRIGFAGGSGMLACIDAKWENDPKTFLRKTANIVSKGLDTIWKYASPLFFPASQIAMGRLESFKHPTEPEMWWNIMLASDAVKRWGLNKATLSQLKNASWATRSRIIGDLILKFPGDKILTQAAKVARPLIVATETLSSIKGIKTELDLVKEYAEKNNVDYNKAQAAYYMSGSAFKPRWEGDKSFRSFISSKLPIIPFLNVALQAKQDPDFQELGREVFKYIKENKKEPVKKEVIEKGELPHGTGPENWAINIKEQMDKKQIAENQPIGVNRYMQLIK